MRCLAKAVNSSRPATGAAAVMACTALLAAVASSSARVVSVFAPAARRRGGGTVRPLRRSVPPALTRPAVDSSPNEYGGRRRRAAAPVVRLYSTSSGGPTDPHASSTFVLDPRSAEAREVTSGLGIDQTRHDALTDLTSLVVEWNERINLISRRECTEEVVFGRHVLPSAALCALRDSPLGRPSSSVPDAAAAAEKGVTSVLEGMTVAELKEMLRKEGKPVSGKKAELVERLRSPPSIANASANTSTRTDGRRMKVADVGTGGGFPGLPLAILYPHVDFVLIDSVGKKLRVVEGMADSLGLQNVKVHHGRVEELVDNPLEGGSHRGAYDAVLGRSVTSLPRFCFWVSDLLRKKRAGADDDDDANGEGRLVYIIGGKVEQSVVSRVQSDTPIDDLLDYAGASDKRALILAASAVEQIAAESGEIKKKRGTGRAKSKRRNANVGQGRGGAKGEWKKKNSAEKKRGYENFKRYNG